MSAVVIKYGGQMFGAERISKLLNGTECVAVTQVFMKSHWRNHSRMTTDEEEARRWLCDHGLRKSKAKKLLAAALRGEGEFADEAHPARVIL